jgi:hypothetical protein
MHVGHRRGRSGTVPVLSLVYYCSTTAALREIHTSPCNAAIPPPLGSLRGRSPATTCRQTRADRRARLRQTILLPAHPLCSIRRSQDHGVSGPIASLRGSCSDWRSYIHAPVSSALATRLPPNSPPNPTFALRAEYRGLPITRPLEHAPLRADLECRCIGSHAASQSRRSSGETPSDRSLRGERRRSDGKATTLRSSRADLAAFWGCHALGTSMRRWGCAGRSYPSHSRPRRVQRSSGSEAHGASKSRQSNFKLALVAYWYGPAVCAGRSRYIWHIADGKRASGCSHVTLSTGRPLPACSRRLASLLAACSLCYAYGMHASRRQQQACVMNAAADGTCVRHHRNRCDLIEVAAMLRMYPASPLTRGRRDVRERPRCIVSACTLLQPKRTPISAPKVTR